MADTLEVALPAGVWTNVSGTLTDGTNYLLQNRGSQNIEIQDSTTAPANDEQGFLIYPKRFITIRPTSTSDIYARPVSGIGSVQITESV